MRSLIFVLIIALVLVIVAIGSGFLKISQVRTGEVPKVTATRSGLTAKGGEPPAFDVQTGSVKVGAQETRVKVPTLVVQRPGTDHNQAASNNAM